jgi:nucleoside 2-deoxyribosyltransferase
MAKELAIYLAGPMDGCSGLEMNDWRDKLKSCCSRLNHILWLNPVTRTDAHNLIESGFASYDTHKYVFDCDLTDVRFADIIVANVTRTLGAGRGTNFELGYAYALNRRIFLLESSNCKPHPFYESIKKHPGNQGFRTIYGAADELRRIYDLQGHPYANITE